jgi:hypothetical protein
MNQQVNAENMDWSKINYFTPKEFLQGSLKYLDPKLIVELDSFRHALGQRVHPSPAFGGLYRLDGSVTSRHYAVNRLSDAADIFPEGDVLKAFQVAKEGPWGGIGIYLDTRGPNGKPWPMLHLDLRPGTRILWARIKEDKNGKLVERYIYPHRSSAEKNEFNSLLNKLVAI